MAGGHNHGPHASPLHTTLAKGFLVVTFLWIFYRAKQDGAVLLVSWWTRRACLFWVWGWGLEVVRGTVIKRLARDVNEVRGFGCV
jgi:hypothetical protein